MNVTSFRQMKHVINDVPVPPLCFMVEQGIKTEKPGFQEVSVEVAKSSIRSMHKYLENDPTVEEFLPKKEQRAAMLADHVNTITAKVPEEARDKVISLYKKLTNQGPQQA